MLSSFLSVLPTHIPPLWKGTICFELAHPDELMKYMDLSTENHLCSKQEHLAHCFPVRIELIFDRTTS
jgi:hypothetical protein